MALTGIRTRRGRKDSHPSSPSVTFLRACPLFQDRTQEFLQELVRHTRVEVFPSGAMITREGEISDVMLFLRHGAAEVLVGPRQTRVAKLGSGGTFGEAALLSPRHARTATLRGIEPCVCRVLTRGSLKRVLRRFPAEERKIFSYEPEEKFVSYDSEEPVPEPQVLNEGAGEDQDSPQPIQTIRAEVAEQTSPPVQKPAVTIMYSASCCWARVKPHRPSCASLSQISSRLYATASKAVGSRDAGNHVFQRIGNADSFSRMSQPDSPACPPPSESCWSGSPRSWLDSDEDDEGGRPPYPMLSSAEVSKQIPAAIRATQGLPEVQTLTPVGFPEVRTPTPVVPLPGMPWMDSEQGLQDASEAIPSHRSSTPAPIKNAAVPASKASTAIEKRPNSAGMTPMRRMAGKLKPLAIPNRRSSPDRLQSAIQTNRIGSTATEHRRGSVDASSLAKRGSMIPVLPPNLTPLVAQAVEFGSQTNSLDSEA